MTRDGFLRYVPADKYGSAAVEIQAILSNNDVVCQRFHTTPAARLLDLKDALGLDVLVCGSETAERNRYGADKGHKGLSPLDAGPL